MAITAGDIRNGKTLEIEGSIFQVIESDGATGIEVH